VRIGTAITRLVCAAAFVAGLHTSFFSAPALAVPHTGSIFDVTGGGVAFSSVHRSKPSSPATANGLQFGISGDIAYEWLPAGPAGIGSKQIFDRGPTRIFDGTKNAVRFTMDLWTGPTGTDAGDLNVVTGRSGTVETTSIDGFNLTNLVEGRFGFTVTELDSTGAVVGELFDEFIVDDTFDMGPADAWGNKIVDGQNVVGTFIWGWTSDPGTRDCVTGDCGNILAGLYGATESNPGGLGIDIAYTGSVPVAEPGTLALFGFGLAAAGALRRRGKRA